MKKVIIIGCTSGIGFELARQYLKMGYIVGGTGRRAQILDDMEKEWKGRFFGATLDMTEYDTVAPVCASLLSKTGGMDLFIISAAFSSKNKSLEFAVEDDIIRTNVNGFVASANFAAKYFINQKSGHLAGISSVAKYFGNPGSLAYNASKAFISTYMEGLSLRLEKHSVSVTDIRPGFVDTPMIAGLKHSFWLVSVEKAARQIIQSIGKRKRIVYISKRWRIASWILPHLPYRVFRVLNKVDTGDHHLKGETEPPSK
ncbi:MAG: SDR family NAD(P)-dependent oxidoreductase [Calditrichaceae bacterium]